MGLLALLDKLRKFKTDDLRWHYSAVGLKTIVFPLAGTTVFKQSPL